jgi:HTH-type transcriptional regulator / antitoxin MqsA
MPKNPRNYPNTLVSPESGRKMRRGEKLLSVEVDGRVFQYYQPGWWCSLKDPNDVEGQLVDADNKIADMARRTAQALAEGEKFTPLLIRAIRMRCGLSQREAGLVFGTGAKSFEKYESGQIRPSDPTKRLLRLALEHRELFAKTKSGSLRVSSAAPDNDLIERTIREANLDRLYGPMFRQRRSA